MSQPITDYEVVWDTVSNEYSIYITMSDGSYGPLQVSSETEFAVVLMLLSKQGVMYDDSTGHIGLPKRSVGT